MVQEFDSKLEECLAVKEILVGQESGGPPKNNQNNTESGNPNKNLRKPQRTIRNVPNRRKQLNKASSASESEDSDFENPNRKQHKKPVVSSLRAPNVRGKAKRLVRNVIEETDSSGMNNYLAQKKYKPYILPLNRATLIYLNISHIRLPEKTSQTDRLRD